MPDVRNCRRCGKIYNYLGGAPICPVCKEDDEADFRRVKEYLYKNPGATLSEVSTVLEIGVEKIKGFLKEGRLEIINGESNLVLECESCGKAISTGRFCEACSRMLNNELKSTAGQIKTSLTQSQEAKKSVEMRYLNKEESKRKH
jgi:flagellar operon protein (TIGR03826 family)